VHGQADQSHAGAPITTRRKPIVSAALLLLTMTATAAPLDSLQCGTALVNIGDTRDQVQLKCGNPANVQRSTAFVRSMAWVNGVPVAAGDSLIEVPVELWLYDAGPGQPPHRLRFESGRVVGIEALAGGSE
jgi:hypothetical protein